MTNFKNKLYTHNTFKSIVDLISIVQHDSKIFFNKNNELFTSIYHKIFIVTRNKCKRSIQ